MIGSRKSLTTLGFCLLALIGCDQSGVLQNTDQNTPDTRPNILIINTDDLDFDELGIYWNDGEQQLPSYTRAEQLRLAHTGARGQTLGYLKVGPMLTPHIDQLAREGMIFSRYYVTSPVCTPSRFSLLTGRYASRSHALRARTRPGEPPLIEFNTPLEGELTLPKLFRERGYRTGLAGKWHNYGSRGSSRGNGRIANLQTADPADPQTAAELREGYDKRVDELLEEAGFEWVGALYPGNVEELGIPAALYQDARHNLEWITAAAKEFIQDASDERPFLLYVAPTAPHGWMGRIGRDEQALLTPSGILDQPPDSGMPSREKVYQRVRDAGHGRPMGSWLDDAVGELLATLESSGVADNTVVIFTSDHGNRGKESVYEAARAPLIIRWPQQVPAGSMSQALVANIDILPTLLELTTTRASAQFDGLSFLPVLTGRAESTHDSIMLEMSLSRALVSPRWKYIAHRPPPEVAQRISQESALPRNERRHGWDGNWNRLDGGKGPWKQSPRINYRNQMFFPAYFDQDQLYDLAQDNMEQHNLAGDPGHAQQLTLMQKQLAQVLRKTEQPTDWFFSTSMRAGQTD